MRAFMEEDLLTGKKGFNLAAILLLGKPEVSKVFVNIGYADSLGSGVRNLYR